MSRRRGKRSKARYYWDGLQFPATNVSDTLSSFELVGATAQEFMPGTVVAIRGSIWLGASSTSNSDVALKIMYLEINDAGTITGDHKGIDTHEEDIATRQLWTYYTTLTGATAGQPDDVRQIDLDVRSKLRLTPAGKKILVLLAQSEVSPRVSMSGYIRVCTRMDN